MKVLVKETDQEGLAAFLGKKICIMSLNYIYSGVLVGINETCVKLAEAEIVYETGEWGAKTWKTRQKFPGDWYVQMGCIESFGPGK